MRDRSLLDRVTAETQHALLDSGPELVVGAEAYVVHDGDDADAAYLVVEGLLKIVKTSLGGKVSFLGLRGQGCLVGELGLLGDGSRSSGMQAVQDSRLIRIDKPRFETLLHKHPDFSRALLEELTIRLDEATSQIHDLMAAEAVARMASRLSQLADEHSGEAQRGAKIELPVSQQELGEWAGLSRAGAVKALKELRDAGLIETSRMVIDIRDIDGLRTMAVA